VKAAWAGLWAALGITAPAVSGYSLDYIRNVANGYETPLPEWTGQFSRFWTRGFMAMIGLFIYFLPAFVIMLVGFLPALGVLAVGDSQNAVGALAGMGAASLCFTSVIAVAYILVMSVFSQAAVVHFALNDSFGSLFEVKAILARLRTQSGYFTAWGMSIAINLGLAFAAGMVGAILGAIVIGVPFAGFAGGVIGFIGSMMSSHLFGQYAARAYGLPGLAPLAAVPYTQAAPAAYAPPVAYAPPAPPAPPAYAPPAPPAPCTPLAPPVPPAYAPPAPPAPPADAPPAPPAE
jgi:hypothetical protein